VYNKDEILGTKERERERGWELVDNMDETRFQINVKFQHINYYFLKINK
jgi:hypothetical protein